MNNKYMLYYTLNILYIYIYNFLYIVNNIPISIFSIIFITEIKFTYYSLITKIKKV